MTQTEQQHQPICEIQLVRNLSSTRLGLSVCEGKIKHDDDIINGVFIRAIAESSEAAKKQLEVGDRILSINDRDAGQMTLEQIAQVLKTESEIKLNIAKNVTEASATHRKESIAVQEITTDDEVEDDEDESEESGHVYSKAGKQIDRASAANVRVKGGNDTEEEDEYGYTMAKIKQRYGNLGQVEIAHIDRQPGSPIGLALVGHRDRQKMGCFIAGINPNLMYTSNYTVKPGDEILEVNGQCFHDRCHLNITASLKAMSESRLKVILLRHGISDNGPMAVKEYTKFPPEFDELAELQANYINVKSITIQKLGTSLGIMVIEGKHAELGKGIFVSDIQEGSTAETSGLVIGDMVLAVNKDIICESTYDEATATLKRVEGVVTLTISRPTKAEAPPEPEKPPEPEPPKDPATAEIQINKETLIELSPASNLLGLCVCSGHNNKSVFIVMVRENGVAGKDGRLKQFDEILELNAEPVNGKIIDFYQRYEKVTMKVYRSDPSNFHKFQVELVKKGGLGIGVRESVGAGGLLITEIIKGGPADGKVNLYDRIVTIDGFDIKQLPFPQAAGVLKCVDGKVKLEIERSLEH